MNAARIVFRNWSHALLAGATSLAVFMVATWFPNLRLIMSIWSDSSATLADKITLPIRLLESITTNFTVLSASYTIAIAILAGVNVAFIAYIVRRQKERLSAAGMTVGILGIFSGATGLGCAACGSLIISSLLATTGGASALVLLPLRGGEFGILGVGLLFAATYSLAKHITKPASCEVTV